MTIICWDGKTLAADGRVTEGSYIKCDEVIKLYALDDIKYHGDILIYAGLAGCCSLFSGYIVSLHNEDIDDYESPDVEGIVVGKEKVYVIESEAKGLVAYPRETKIAEGSGCRFGLSALKLGMSSKEAIEHVITLDAGCGGKITCVDL